MVFWVSDMEPVDRKLGVVDVEGTTAAVVNFVGQYSAGQHFAGQCSEDQYFVARWKI